jgi:hypothetical protein
MIMKKINMKKLGLGLMVLCALVFNSNIASAQVEEDEQGQEQLDDEEVEQPQFHDDMNRSRFESSFDRNNSFENKRESFRPNNNNSYDNEDNQYREPRELDIDINRSTRGTEVLGVGGASRRNPGNASVRSSGGVSGTLQGYNPPRGTQDPNTSFPDNPEDPDVPVDGGLGLLLAAGAGYGFYKRKRRAEA